MSFGGSYESGDGKEHENGPNRKEHEPEARDLHNAQDVSNPDKKHRIICPTKTLQRYLKSPLLDKFKPFKKKKVNVERGGEQPNVSWDKTKKVRERLIRTHVCLAL